LLLGGHFSLLTNNSERGYCGMNRKKKSNRGRPKGSGNGPTVTTLSITLPPEEVRKIDDLRGDLSRGKFILLKMNKSC
jgi:hypothetical protein